MNHADDDQYWVLALAIDEAILRRDNETALRLSLDSLEYLAILIDETVSEFGGFDILRSIAVDYLTSHYIRTRDDLSMRSLLQRLSEHQELSEWVFRAQAEFKDELERRTIFDTILRFTIENPGSHQDIVLHRFCDGRKDEMRQFLRVASEDGYIRREKSGRTYLLYPIEHEKGLKPGQKQGE